MQAALPDLLKQLPAVRQDVDDEDRNAYKDVTLKVDLADGM